MKKRYAFPLFLFFFILGMYLKPSSEVTLNFHNTSGVAVKLLKVRNKNIDSEFVEDLKHNDKAVVRIGAGGDTELNITVKLDNGEVITSHPYVQSGWTENIIIKDKEMEFKNVCFDYGDCKDLKE